MLLLIRYAPLHELVVSGSGHHCVECTESYCTRERCTCDHEHKRQRPHEAGVKDGHQAWPAWHAAIPDEETHHLHGGTDDSFVIEHARHTRPAAPEMKDRHRSAYAPSDATGRNAADLAGSADLNERRGTESSRSEEGPALRPCGTEGAHAVPTLLVDHFLLTRQSAYIDYGDDSEHTSVLPSIVPQTRGEDVFHPPARRAQGPTSA